jgi:hypothetical protein
MVRCESRPSTIGHITLGTKQTGAPSAGNLHAGCDVAGAGNGFTVWLLRHSQRKRGETARPDLRNTAPVLDPTGQYPGMCASAAARKSPWGNALLCGTRSGCVYVHKPAGVMVASRAPNFGVHLDPWRRRSELHDRQGNEAQVLSCASFQIRKGLGGLSWSQPARSICRKPPTRRDKSFMAR